MAIVDLHNATDFSRLVAEHGREVPFDLLQQFAAMSIDELRNARAGLDREGRKELALITSWQAARTYTLADKIREVAKWVGGMAAGITAAAPLLQQGLIEHPNPVAYLVAAGSAYLAVDTAKRGVEAVESMPTAEDRDMAIADAEYKLEELRSRAHLLDRLLSKPVALGLERHRHMRPNEAHVSEDDHGSSMRP